MGTPLLRKEDPALLTGEAKFVDNDWAAPMPRAWPVTEDMKSPGHLPVAVGRACSAGDAVAVVVAETSEQAHDAVEPANGGTR